MKIIHQGRGGYVELEGSQYPIEQIEAGCFCVAFPSGNRHNLQAHLDHLTTFVNAKTPRWYIENRSTLVPTRTRN